MRNKKPKIILTNMCMLYKDDGSFLVEERKRSDWPGITFPGGHVEPNESIRESVIREIKEETNLVLKDLEFVTYYEWNLPNEGKRHLGLLFRSNNFEGELKEGNEGPLYWLKEEDLKDKRLSTDFWILYQKLKP